MEQPKVSILVPIYGVENYIKRCAISLMEQTYKNIEYIFVDDATPDHSVEILQGVIADYPERKQQVQILRHEHNRGLSAARNTAVEAATGKYLLHVDSDDYITLQAIEKLTTVAEVNETDIVVFDTIELRETGEVLLRAEYKDRISYIKGLLQHTCRCAHWNKFYRTDFYKQTGIQSVETIRLAEDYAVTPRLVHQAKRICVLHEGLYYYETRNQNSYVHNLNRAALESQHRADYVLVNYFSQVNDATEWADIIEVLSQRSISALLKHSNRETWPLIRDVYANELRLSGNKLKWIDRIIYRLFQTERTHLLVYILFFYRFLFEHLR